jgi:hypothetical protein
MRPSEGRSHDREVNALLKPGGIRKNLTTADEGAMPSHHGNLRVRPTAFLLTWFTAYPNPLPRFEAICEYP